MKKDFTFWLGKEAETIEPNFDEMLIENQFWTAVFVPEIDSTDIDE